MVVYQLVSAVAGQHVTALHLEPGPEAMVGDLKLKLFEQRPDLCPAWVKLLHDEDILDDTMPLEVVVAKCRAGRVNEDGADGPHDLQEEEVELLVLHTVKIDMLLTEFPASRLVLAQSLGAMGESAKPHLLELLGSELHDPGSADHMESSQLVDTACREEAWKESARKVLTSFRHLLACEDDDLKDFKIVLTPIVADLFIASTSSEAARKWNHIWTWLGKPAATYLMDLLANAKERLCIRVTAAQALGTMDCKLGEVEDLLASLADCSTEEEAVRAAVISSLGAICTSGKHASLLVRLQKREKNEIVRNAAVEAVNVMSRSANHIVKSVALRAVSRLRQTPAF